MPQTFALSESAVAVLRFRVKGYRMKVTDRSLEAFRELAAGIMEPVPGADGNPEADYRFTEDGCAAAGAAQRGGGNASPGSLADGATFAGPLGNPSIGLWDVATARPIGAAVILRRECRSLAFPPGGKPGWRRDPQVGLCECPRLVHSPASEFRPDRQTVAAPPSAALRAGASGWARGRLAKGPATRPMEPRRSRWLFARSETYDSSTAAWIPLDHELARWDPVALAKARSFEWALVQDAKPACNGDGEA